MVYIKAILIALYLIIVGIVFFASFYILNYNRKLRKTSKNSNKKKYEKVDQLLKKNEKGYFSYSRIERFLKRNGNPLKLSVSGFLISKFIISFIIFVISSNDVVLAIPLSFLGFFMLDILYIYSNKKDMKKINFQLVDVYDFLNIQTSAGVFVGNALTEAYLVVRNERLKKALAELCAEINLTKDIEKALDSFLSNFKSVEIESFVLSIKQSLKTGKLQQAIEDLSNSQKEINSILIEEDTDKIKITGDLIQVMMYLGIIAVIIFGLVTELSKGWSGIF